jgi:Protein of unknown function (DUF664)
MSAKRALGKPERRLADPEEVLLGFLDYYRAVVAAKVGDLDEVALQTSRLPSGWTPLELVKHLVYMERRWFVWGFLAEPVDDPVGDMDAAGRWAVASTDEVGALLGRLAAGGEVTRRVVEGAHLSDVAAAGGRFTETDVRPTLGWILAYVLQEYARHAGHLDIARELADGEVGE